ncbi:hypothetical protein QE152_g5099 [Popillia japonica]|uniref:Uncharacterized protein n=1 Tax=Popillia japonica TaxID=7064 RepID=A0AAW1MPP7_POPJA
MHKEVAEMDRAATPLRLSDRHYNPFQQIRIRDRLIEDWKRKGLHEKEGLGRIDDIISGCTLLAGTQNTERHDNLAKIQHQEIRQRFEDPPFEKISYYKYSPPAVVETKTCTIYWNREIITDRTILNNRPHIVIIDKTNKTTYLIDVAIPIAENITRKQSRKIFCFCGGSESYVASTTCPDTSDHNRSGQNSH